MTTFRTEVIVPSAALDHTNPITTKLFRGICPSTEGAGSLVELVTGLTYNPSTAFTWLADGVKSGSVGSFSGYENAILMDKVPSGGAFSKSFVYVIDIKLSTTSLAANKAPWLELRRNATGADYCIFQHGYYGSEYWAGCSVNYNGNSEQKTESGGGKKLSAIYWDAAVRKLYLYENGVLKKTVTYTAGSLSGANWDTLRLGLGSSYDEFYFGGLFYDVTDEEALQIMTDPYQIFRTTEDEVLDYGLTASGVQHIAIPATTAWTTGTVGLLEWVFIRKATGSVYLVEDGAGGSIRHTDTGGFIGGINIFAYAYNTVLTPSVVGDKVRIRLDFAADGIMSAYTEINDGGLVLNQARGGSGHVPILSSILGSTLSNPLIQLLSVRYEYGADKRHYDFNTPNNGAVLKELLNGQNGTLVGFPVDSGYVIENGEIVGYQLAANTRGSAAAVNFLLQSTWSVVYEGTVPTTGTLYLQTRSDGSFEAYIYINSTKAFVRYSSGSYEITLNHDFTQYGDTSVKVEIRKNSTSSHELFINDVSIATSSTTGIALEANTTLGPMFAIGTTQYSSAKLVDGVTPMRVKRLTITCAGASVNRDYDFTTGDDDSFIDVSDNVDATIVNAKTSGWMPIVGSQVYTLKAIGGDYGSIGAFLSANRYNAANANNVNKLLVFGTVQSGSYMNHSGYGNSTNFPHGIEILGDSTIPHNGEYDKAGVSTLETTVNGIPTILPYIKVTNLQVTTNNVQARGILNSLANSVVIVEDVIVKNLDVSNDYSYSFMVDGAGATAVFKRCGADGTGGSTFNGAASNSVVAIDCISRNGNVKGGIYRGGFTNLEAHNCISVGTLGSPDFKSVTGSNNISEDNSATVDSIGTGSVDFTGAFADA